MTLTILNIEEAAKERIIFTFQRRISFHYRFTAEELLPERGPFYPPGDTLKDLPLSVFRYRGEKGTAMTGGFAMPESFQEDESVITYCDAQISTYPPSTDEHEFFSRWGNLEKSFFSAIEIHPNKKTPPIVWEMLMHATKINASHADAQISALKIFQHRSSQSEQEQAVFMQMFNALKAEAHFYTLFASYCLKKSLSPDSLSPDIQDTALYEARDEMRTQRIKVRAERHTSFAEQVQRLLANYRLSSESTPPPSTREHAGYRRHSSSSMRAVRLLTDHLDAPSSNGAPEK